MRRRPGSRSTAAIADGEHQIAVGFSAGRAQADHGRRRPGRAPARRSAPASGQRVPPGPAGVGEGPAGAATLASGRRSSTALWPAPPGDARRVRPRTGPAQRPARTDQGRDGGTGGHGEPGTSNSAATPSHCATTVRRRSICIGARFAALAADLGLSGTAELRYRPRTKAATAEQFAAELPERLESDLERGFTAARTASRRPGAAARRARAARLRLAGRAAAGRCWRCCSPSARPWRRSAARHRCCCSTT